MKSTLPHVQFRTPTAQDLRALEKMLQNPMVMQYISPVVDAQTLFNALNIAITHKNNASKPRLMWSICNQRCQFLGIAGFVSVDKLGKQAEMGLILQADCHKQGLGTYTVETLLDYGFNHLAFNHIQARFLATNKAVQSLANKLGFEHLGNYFAPNSKTSINHVGIHRTSFTSKH